MYFECFYLLQLNLKMRFCQILQPSRSFTHVICVHKRYVTFPPIIPIVSCKYFCFYILLGYGFVDFEHPQSAQAAVAALSSKGIQAQMAKVMGYLK